MNLSSVDLLNYILSGMIIIFSIIIFFFGFKFFFHEKTANTKKEVKENDNSLENLDFLTKNAKSIKSKKAAIAEKEALEANIRPGENLLDFDKIHNGMIILNSGKAFSMLLQCRGINFDLMSDEEKIEVNKNFISFFNKILYPIQIHTQTRVLNFHSGFKSYQQRHTNLAAELKGLVLKFNDLRSNHPENTSQISILAKKILSKQRLLEYVKYFIDEIKAITSNAFIIQSNYYLVVSCTAEELKLSPPYKSPSDFQPAQLELTKRSEALIKGLKLCGVESSILHTNQIVQLLYNAFDQGSENFHKVTEMMEAGLFN